MGRLSSIIKISLVSLAGFSLVSNVKTPAKEVQVVEAAESVSSYYSGISDSLTGTSLLTALRTLNSSKKTKDVTYAGFRQGAAYFDKDPDGSGKIIGFYNNAKVGPAWDGGNTWNREHVWPNSRGGNAVEDDAHMIRPTATSINSSRGNNVYSETGPGTYDPGQYYPAYRGIAARIVFYSMVATTGLVLNDSAANEKNNMGKLSELLKWNLEYQPGTSTLELRTEQSRNDAIHAGNSYSQGNRNPFIDHPEYACKIWGDTNATTKQICAGQITGGGTGGDTGGDTTTKPTLNKTEISLKPGATYQLKVENASGTVAWTSGNAKIATVSQNGLVTAGVTEGKTAIIATVGSETLHCVVTVSASASDSGNNEDTSKPALNVTEISLKPGATYQLKVSNVKGTVAWSSGNNRIATVDQNGKVTAGSMEGKTAVIATVDGEALTCIITVSKDAPDLSSGGGCGGSIIASSSILSISGFFALALMIKRKRKLK